MKKRLDVYLTEQGLCETRQKAQAHIMAGEVFVNGQKADKPGWMLKDSDKVELRGEKLPFVSRGGLKLQKAMGEFDITLADKICMDVGASTGGFTDCMLQCGASHVYSIDVGYGQLAWKLRTDSRVTNLERTNIRYLTKEQMPDLIDFTSIDVSFISLGLVLPVVYQFLRAGGQCVALIKPQFEAGKENVGKKGVVRDPSVHAQVINKVLQLAQELHFTVKGITFSPVKGPEGNIEYLLYLQKDAEEGEHTPISSEEIDNLVALSHKTLDK